MHATNCPRCGSPRDASTADGLCPQCLMRDALAAGATADAVDSGLQQEVLPRMLGPYELLEEIGRGGMGVVYRARQTALDRMVAVKLVIGGLFASEAAQRRFQKEAAAVADLHHPGIVAVHDFGECEGQPYLVMELVEGRNLAALCDGRPLEGRRAARLLHGLAEAVAHAHARRVLHRDLKPSNILVDESGHARVTDFGLARRLDEAEGRTLSGLVLCSPSYASPELASGKSDEAGPAVDVYGLGALLYHLLTGRPPFNAATPAETLRLVLEADPPAPSLLNPALPRDLETICLKCLAKDPARRYVSAAALADDVERFLGHRPIMARRPSIAYRIQRFSRRHWIGVASSSGVVIALGLGAALGVHGLLRAERERLAAEDAMDQLAAAQTQLQLDVLHDVDRVGDASPLLPKATAVVRYYASLPTRSRTRSVERQHAEALDLLANVLWASPQHDVSRAAHAAQENLALRQKIAREGPDDDDAAAELIRAEGGARVMENDYTFPFPLEHNADVVRRFEALVIRFPDSPKVKQCLATSLIVYAFAAIKGNLPDEALAAVRRARALRESVVAAGFSDRQLPSIETDCLRAEAEASEAKGDSLAATEAYTLLLERVAEMLRSDPIDDTLRGEASRAALWGSDQVMKTESLDVALGIQQVARDCFRILVSRHPQRRDYRMYYALAHHLEAVYLGYVDGRFDRARAAWLQLDQLYEPAKGHPFYCSYRTDAAFALASIAARSGHMAGARSWIDEARTRYDEWLRAMPAEPEIRLRNRLRFAESAWQILVEIRAWNDALEQANLLSAEADDGLAKKSGLPELVLRRVMADVQAGIALAGLGRSSEAVMRMRDAIDRLPGLPFVHPVYSADGVFREGTLAMCHALADTDGLPEARRRAWALLGNLGFTAGSQWVMNELRARAWVLLARVVDRAEAPLRLACCERATTLLTSPESQGRISRDGREALATAQRLAVEARAAIDALPIETLAERLDAAGTDDPTLVDALVSADERAWGPDSARSACFSQQAREAQIAVRQRCEGLVARRPGSAGARFLHARTFRMEAFVALALGADADVTRAALLDYDARLEPFMDRPGYAAVRRVRASNRMHLARLAASFGDAALASSEVMEARARAETWLASGELTEREAHSWRVQWLQEEAGCTWWLRDWSQLDDTARAIVAEAEAGLAEGAESADLRVGRAVGRAFQTLALQTNGLVAADEAALVECRRQLVAAAMPGATADLCLLVSALEDATIEKLRAGGDPRRARARAERILRAAADLRPFEVEKWSVDLMLAKAQVQLAGLLDPRLPYEEQRRIELLDEAYRRVSERDTAGRRTRDIQETLARIFHLRASCLPGDGSRFGCCVAQMTPCTTGSLRGAAAEKM